jgi:hypothetical protein
MKSDNGSRKPIPKQSSNNTLDHFGARPTNEYHSTTPSRHLDLKKKQPNMQEQATLHAVFA